MTTDPQVSHPPVSHPETITPAAPTADREAAKKSAETPAARRSAAKSWRMPPPKVILAALLVAVAVELLLWQVAGLFWGVLVHAVLAGLVLAVVAGVLAWRRRQTRRLSAGGAAVRGARSTGTAPGRLARTPLGRMLGRSAGRSGSSATGAGRRAGLLGRAGAAGRGLLGRRTGSGAGSAPRSGGRGLLGKLTSGRRSGGASAGGRTGGLLGRASSGRAGGLLSRLGRGSVARRAAAGASRTGAPARRPALGRAAGAMRSAGRGLLSAGKSRAKSAGTSPQRGGLFGQRKAATGASRKQDPGVLAGFMRGVREGAKPKPVRKPKPAAPEPRHAAEETKRPAPQKRAQEEKPQPPTKERLVKEAVEKVAKAKPVVVAPQRTRSAVVGDMNKVRAAADEFAAALKDYDPETMHQLVREMPLIGEALNSIQQGFRQVASRAESEWPVAAPVAEGLRSIADDIKAGAGTADEARGTIRRENETDIERGEAPRHGSVDVERKWNV